MRGATLLLAAAALLVPHPGTAALPRLGGVLEGYGVLRLDRGSTRQRPQARLWLGAEQSLGAVRWRLSTLGTWGGTIEDASGAGLIDFGHAFQPNDLLNPRRWYDPFVIDGIAAKIAVPAVAASYLAFVRRDLAEWGVGIDYLIDGYLPLLEIHQILVLHNDRRLLIPDVDTRLVANLRKRWLEDRLELELAGLWGLEAGYELVRAEVGYALSDALEARLGLLGIWGSRSSLVGEFSRNDETYVRLRYVF